MTQETDFLFTTRPVVGKRVHRLGLACNYGIDEAGIREAVDRGLGYLFWTPRKKHTIPALRSVLKAHRDQIVLATGPTTAWWAGNIRSYVEKTLSLLEIESIDVLQVFWVGVTASLGERNLAELVRLREEGKCRAIGVSIHNRKRAGQLAAASPLDLLMIRYNAAHPGSEQDIFPHLSPSRPRAVVAYTATSWRRLLKRPRGWEGEVATAGHCYRFCLSNPAIHVVLTGPKDRAQLLENLEAVEAGPLSPDEDRWIRSFGAAVHG
jgi:aryl-alcohol dehydrogenase-like predicted oxidoreductase